MAGVATVFGVIGARVDALQAEIRKMQAGNDEKPTGVPAAIKAPVAQDDPRWDSAQADAIRASEERARMRKDIDELRDSQASALKTERSVLEAVLGQKLDRSVSDKVAGVSRRVDEVADALQKAVDRSAAITAAVDKQAKFLVDLNARLTGSIDAAVARALAAQHKAHAPLEDSPALDGDAIDVVPRTAAKKTRAKPAAKKAAATEAKTPVSDEAQSATPVGDHDQE